MSKDKEVKSEKVILAYKVVPRNKAKVTPETSKREKNVTTKAGDIVGLTFDDSKPNYVVVINQTASDVYVGTAGNISATKYDYKIAAGKRFQCVYIDGLTDLNFFCVAAVTVRVMTYTAPLDPIAMALANQ